MPSKIPGIGLSGIGLPLFNRFGIRQKGIRQQRERREGLIVHALHKSASMFLHKFFDDLCRRTNRAYYSIHNDSPEWKKPSVDTDGSFVFGPARSFDISPFAFPRLHQTSHLMQVRDPRDILISQYFSIGWTHSDKDWSEKEKQLRREVQKLDIDQFVLNESRYSRYPLIERYQVILPLLNKPNVHVVTYEDMVLNFRKWLDTVLETVAVQPRSRWRRRLMKRYRDEFRAGPEANSHKRNVTPGDHLNKLKPATIVELNRQYRPVLDALGYPDDAACLKRRAA